MNALFNNNTFFNSNFLTVGAADSLFNDVKSLNWDCSMRSRRTMSYGIAYNYNQMSYPNTDIPNMFNPIIDWVTNSLGWTPNNVLGNWYLDGTNKMGWHSDDTSIMSDNTGVVIVSLGFNRSIQFRPINDKNNIHNIVLNHGSLFYMNNTIQDNFHHAIPPMDNATDRISLTFRKLK